jgi:hypothetical protein
MDPVSCSWQQLAAAGKFAGTTDQGALMKKNESDVYLADSH